MNAPDQPGGMRTPGSSAPGERQVDRSAVDAWAWDRASNPLPVSADVVIVGGGIVGVSAAYFLARRGSSVALLEKGRIAGEQSGRNWGWVRQQGRSPVELPLMMESLRTWQGLAAELGEDPGFRQHGSLYLAETPAQLSELEHWLPVARDHGLDTRMLSAAAVGEVLRCDGVRWAGGMHTASDGRAEPNRASNAIARGARRAGAHIVTSCAVRGIERTSGGVSGAVTEHGTITTRTVVCAAGAWTRLFCGSLGVTVPQLTVLGSVARTAPADAILEGEAWSPSLAIRRRLDGGYTVAHGGSFLHPLTPASFRFARSFLPAWRQGHGSTRIALDGTFARAFATPTRWRLDVPSPFERERMLDPAPEPRVLEQARAALERWFPALGTAPFVETWGGMIETSPDVLPVIAPVAGLDGFYVATGFSGHGFGIGPGAGKLIADMVTGGAVADELSRFRLTRFFDGSPIRPGPAI